MNGPLRGYRVVEAATFISGPLAGMLLADLGAEVIKVEAPGTGDPFRGWGERRRSSPHFAAFNRGKKSVTLDLRTESGRCACLDLVATADVVIYPVGVTGGSAHRSVIGESSSMTAPVVFEL